MCFCLIFFKSSGKIFTKKNTKIIIFKVGRIHRTRGFNFFCFTSFEPEDSRIQLFLRIFLHSDLDFQRIHLNPSCHGLCFGFKDSDVSEDSRISHGFKETLLATDSTLDSRIQLIPRIHGFLKDSVKPAALRIRLWIQGFSCFLGSQGSRTRIQRGFKVLSGNFFVSLFSTVAAKF